MGCTRDGKDGVGVARGLAVLIGLAMGLAACSGEAVPDDQAAVDREMELALEGEAEPELRDEGDREPAAEQPPRAPAQSPLAATPPREVEPAEDAVVPEPAREVPAPPAMLTLTAAAGAEFEVELEQELSTRTSQPGDRFTARLTRPIIDDSKVIVSVGSIVRGEVTAVQRSGGQGQAAVIKITFHQLFIDGENWPLAASVVDAQPQTRGEYSTGDKAARIGVGAVAGGILGRVIGGNARGTVIGAAVGAAAGTAITLATEDVDAVLPRGSILKLRLDEPFTHQVPEPGDG